MPHGCSVRGQGRSPRAVPDTRRDDAAGWALSVTTYGQTRRPRARATSTHGHARLHGAGAPARAGAGHQPHGGCLSAWLRREGHRGLGPRLSHRPAMVSLTDWRVARHRPVLPLRPEREIWIWGEAVWSPRLLVLTPPCCPPAQGVWCRHACVTRQSWRDGSAGLANALVLCLWEVSLGVRVTPHADRSTRVPRTSSASRGERQPLISIRWETTDGRV